MHSPALQNSPRVAILHEYFEHMGGAERVLVALKKIFSSSDLYFLLSDNNLVKRHFPSNFRNNAYKDTFLRKIPGIHKNYIKFLSLGLFFKAVESINLRGYDLIISSSNSFMKGVIIPEGSYHISYIHSPTRYLWDYHFDYAKEKAGSRLKRFFIQKRLQRLQMHDFILAQRPDLLVANSLTVKKRIKKYYYRDSELIYPPVDLNTDQSRVSFNKGEYFLCVSYLTKFKKINLLLETFRMLPSERLIIAGEGPEKDNLKKQAPDNVSFLGYITDKELVHYYQNCKALVSAVIEDFGIVPVEANSFGKPAIVLQDGGFRETIEEGLNGLFFKTQDPLQIKSTIEKFLLEQDYFDPHQIFESTARYSFENFKNCIINILPDIYRRFF
jgi:glycosyltransferase involved in cell wall biosynthesis